MSKAAKAAKRATRTNRRFAGLGVILVIVALLALMAAPAFAHHKDDHENGGGQASESSSTSSGSDHDGDAGSDEFQYTEDNDTNDNGTGEDVADEGDNAHPSGKDRSVENGSSTKNPNQGNAESDPDDDGRGPDRTNGGPDKPNGSGGVDKADQDGNNGCGNDDDFEDDNEGWCGKKPAPVTSNEVLPEIVQKSVCPAGTDKAGQEMADLKDCNEDADVVLGRIDEANPKVERPDTVLGTMIRNSGPAVAAAAAAPAAVLPFTGADLTVFAGIAATLILLGMVALRVRSES